MIDDVFFSSNSTVARVRSKNENFVVLASHYYLKFSFEKIAADPYISTTGTIHVRNTYLAAANIKSTQKCENFAIRENLTT